MAGDLLALLHGRGRVLRVLVVLRVFRSAHCEPHFHATLVGGYLPGAIGSIAAVAPFVMCHAQSLSVSRATGQPRAGRPGSGGGAGQRWRGRAATSRDATARGGRSLSPGGGGRAVRGVPGPAARPLPACSAPRRCAARGSWCVGPTAVGGRVTPRV